MTEFSAPMTLTTPAGSLTFNGTGDGLYLTSITGLDGAPLRNPVDDLPQTDGTLVHRFFRSGKRVTLRGYILANAGTTTRRGYEDNLRGYLDRLIRPTEAELTSTCRLTYTPSGASDRMIDQLRVFEPVQISGGYFKEFEFTLISPFPYSRDAADTTTALNATVTNTGNASMFPVFKLQSTFTGATITNTTTGETIVFSSGISSGYAEVDTFRKTVYLNGNSTNLLSKLNFNTTTFFQLIPGANVLTVSFTGSSGASASVIWAPAWA